MLAYLQNFSDCSFLWRTEHDRDCHVGKEKAFVPFGSGPVAELGKLYPLCYLQTRSLPTPTPKPLFQSQAPVPQGLLPAREMPDASPAQAAEPPSPFPWVSAPLPRVPGPYSAS